jgi:hypothetical protein
LVTVGESLLRVADLTTRSRNAPSHYADPVAWLATEAAEQAILRSSEEVLAQPDDVGVLAVSDECTVATMRDIAARMRRGRISPLTFAGANPGSLAGLPCLRWRLRGPTMTLTMPPERAHVAASAIVRLWLASGQARLVLVLDHWREPVSGTDGPRPVSGTDGPRIDGDSPGQDRPHVVSCRLLRAASVA